MPDGRGWRFGLEVAFLVALAVVLGVAEVGASVIVLVMLVGWVLVALLEWAAWREEPHWGSGSPPRYYVPPASIPPRRVIDQGYKVEQGYPAQREPDAPTWVATPEMRAAALEDWPVPPPADESDESDDVPVGVDVAPEAAPASVAEAPLAEPPVSSPEPQPAEPQTAAPQPAEPEPEPERVEEPLEAALLLEAAAAVTAEDAPMAVEEPYERAAEANGADPWEEQSFPDGGDLEEDGAVLQGTRTSLHRIDPLTEPEGRRWPWQRRADGALAGATEFPARPRHVLLPQSPDAQRREDER